MVMTFHVASPNPVTHRKATLVVTPYVEPPKRAHTHQEPTTTVVFPIEELVPETTRHLELRTALPLTLRNAFGDRATVGSDQFVYYHPQRPSDCCAPDVFVRLGQKQAHFDTWKVWERGRLT